MFKHQITIAIIILLNNLHLIVVGLQVHQVHHFIESPKLSHWGEWGKLEHCPSDQVVVGMRLKVHHNQGMKDDTGLNAVKFYCQNPYSSREYSEDFVSITSLVGNNGVWKKDFFCPRDSEKKLIAVGFQLRSETSSGVKDDTAGNNLKLICSDLYQRQGYVVLDGDGTTRGEWTKQQLCWSGFAICGIQSQVEITRSMDTTGLNNLKVRCCKVDISEDNKNSYNTTHFALGDGSSSEDSSSSSSSSSGENSINKGANQHDNSEEDGKNNGSGEVSDDSSEQELIAIDPEPTDFLTSSESSDHLISSIVSKHEETVSHEEKTNLTNIKESDDDNLQEEIARIDPVDNAEAHLDDDLSSTATYSLQNIPEDVVNALEDADTADSKDDDESRNSSTRILITHAMGTTSNDSRGTAKDENMIVLQTEYSRHKSSPRFGEIETINTTIVASKASGSVFQSSTISVSAGLLMMLALLVNFS